MDLPIVLGDHDSDLVSGACADHIADASSDACSGITDRVQSGCLSRREARGKACCEGILIEFVEEIITFHIPLVYTVNATYFGTIPLPETSSIYKQRNVANP